MRFLVITNAPTLHKDDAYHAYAPYVKEMNLWFSKVDKLSILSPTVYEKPLLTAPFKRQDIEVISVPFIQLGGVSHLIKSIFQVPLIAFKMYAAMKKADHIHLRCPGNIGLIAAFVQVLFPSKKKTTKYAGNWDPKAKQPWSYRLQKRILGNTRLTKNMQVLVYGDWPNQTKNIKSFFTATYRDSAKVALRKPKYETPFKILFVGSLAIGKRPLYAIQFIEQCNASGISCELDMYGDGAERKKLEAYITQKELGALVRLHGNQDASTVQKAYQNSHFIILPSKSEGWPKVIAEAMFWGTIPLVTPISCVPWMLANGQRGQILSLNLEADVSAFAKAVSDTTLLTNMSSAGQQWSQGYTLDTFEKAIEELI
jgi:glycosyltransferase involved in cell wall biosynthesis